MTAVEKGGLVLFMLGMFVVNDTTDKVVILIYGIAAVVGIVVFLNGGKRK